MTRSNGVAPPRRPLTVTIVYAVHGLRIRSEIALSAEAVAGDEFDVDLRLGPPAPVPDARPVGGRLTAAVRTGDAYRFVAVDHGSVVTLRVPSVCDFVIGAVPGRVVCHPDPAAEPGLMAILATGLLVSYLLIANGHCVLHASAVEVDGAAVAFLGRSGIGKSTMAALCCAAGARLVTDDVLRLDTDAGVHCVGGSGHLRLRPHASWALDRFATAPATANTADGRVAVMAGPTETPDVPLATIVVLHPSRTASAVAVTAVAGADAFLKVMAHTRVSGWEDGSVRRRLFGAVAEVVDSVTVVEAVVPWGTPCDPSIGASLLELVARRP